MLSYPRKIGKILLLVLAQVFGEPTATDVHDKKVIWDIKAQGNREYTTTFSENTAQAELHTDTQYRRNPEKYVLLAVIKSAKRGGVSLLLDGRKAVQELQKTKKGRICLSILKKNKFPFRVPTVYTKKRKEEMREVIWAPVISKKPFLRFRKDTILRGFEQTNVKAEVKWAIEYFSCYINTKKNIRRVKLQKGDIVIMKNDEALHGRTKFKDKQRHLWRIRVT